EARNPKCCAPMSATRSESFNFPYVTIGRGGCLFRTASVLTRVQVRRIPIPPMMLAVGLLVLAVVFLRLAQDLGKSCDFHGSCSRRLPFAAGKTRCDLLKQPAVPIWILERGKREVGTALRVAPAHARILHGVVEGAAGIVEDLAHVNAAGDQVVTGGVNVIHGED